MAIAGMQSVAVLDSEAGSIQNGEERQANRPASIVQMWRELEDERLGQSSSPVRERITHQRVDSPHRLNFSSEDREWSPSPAGSDNGQEDASDLGESERERVRQIFREWRTTSSRDRASSAQGTREWLGEMEQERVRVIREHVHQTIQQRDPHAAGRIERVLDELGHNNDGSSESSSRRIIRRLCGRQAWLDMIKKAERERQLEIQSLSQHCAVSQFAYRIRIQSVLRGRFLRHGREIEDRDTSRRRGEFRQRRSLLLESSPPDHSLDELEPRTTAETRDQMTEESAPRTRTEAQTIPEIPHSNPTDQVEPQTSSEARIPSPSDQRNPQTTHETCDSSPPHESELQAMPEATDSTPPDQGVDELEPQIRDDTHDSPQTDEPEPRSSQFEPYYEPSTSGDGGQRLELREVFNMRSVTTLLSSGFRRNLDDVLQSYIQRQNEQAEEDDSDVVDPHRREPAQAANEDALWDRDSNFIIPHSFGNEWDMMSDLRIDIARLHRRMNSMQRVLETCMDMQIELQRSIKQEISFALKSSTCPQENDTKSDDVRRGVCCLCHTNTIDSLLYRCGHLCTCVTCADELLRNSGKCPMCCAPVAEVIRAYVL